MNLKSHFQGFLFLSLTFWASIIRAEYADDCTTTTGLSGKCMPIASCANVEKQLLEIKAGQINLTTELKTNLRNLNCGIYDGVHHVCCSNDQIQQNSGTMNLLRGLKCGQAKGLRVAHGTEVELSSRPWMALLKYQINGVDQFLCGATLISERFVLTAAHCIIGRENNLKQVRLGEHRISTEKDCVFRRKKEICADPVEDVDIERFILHPKYNRLSGYDDIALIKLKRNVTFHKHIKPICLPITPELKAKARTIDTFFVAGWGTTENGTTSDVLLEAKIQNTELSTCTNLLRKETLESQICAGGDELRDSCKGDSGGPILSTAAYVEEYLIRLVQFGIVSLGVVSCGITGMPGIYTNVGYYMQWITDYMAT